MVAPAHAPTQRIDKYLWYVRLAKSRSAARAMAERGIMRLNGRRIERAHNLVRVGDLITLARADNICVVRVLALPDRRGPANMVDSWYEELQLGD